MLKENETVSGNEANNARLTVKNSHKFERGNEHHEYRSIILINAFHMGEAARQWK